MRRFASTPSLIAAPVCRASPRGDLDPRETAVGHAQIQRGGLGHDGRVEGQLPAGAPFDEVRGSEARVFLVGDRSHEEIAGETRAR